MDYVEWVGKVREVILSSWRMGDEYTKQVGVEMQNIVDGLGLQIDSRAPDFETGKAAAAIRDAIKDLDDEGWGREVAFCRFKPTDAGRKLPADQSAVWNDIIAATPLDDEQFAVLRSLNDI